MSKYLILLLLFIPCIGFSDVPEKQLAEVKYLLEFIKNSKCNLVRNGDAHTGEIAVNHIDKKYNYYRDEINSTEDFIEYSATKSTLSGKYYMVNCPGRTSIKVSNWLLQELQHFRNTSTSVDINKANVKTTVCKEPRPQICTMEYVPVCAQFENDIVKTYASACSACSDKKVKNYREENCSSNN